MIVVLMEYYLIPAKQGVEHQTSIWQLVAWKGITLLHGTCIWRPGLAQVGIIRIVVGPVCCAECVFRTDECRGRMSKIIVHFGWCECQK